jgi:hypothetical protein
MLPNRRVRRERFKNIAVVTSNNIFNMSIYRLAVLINDYIDLLTFIASRVRYFQVAQFCCTLLIAITDIHISSGFFTYCSNRNGTSFSHSSTFNEVRKSRRVECLRNLSLVTVQRAISTSSLFV